MTYVSINGHTIRANATLGTDHPPIRIARTKNGPADAYAREIKINGPSRLVYNADKRILKCGARMVLEADDGTVEIVR